MGKAKCKECDWNGNEDELVSTSVSISFVHCPVCGSDNTVTETEDESAFEEAG